MHHRASQTDEEDAPVPGVDQAVQTDTAVPAVPAPDPSAPRGAVAPAPAPAPAVPAVAAGDHPLAAEFAAILDAEWPVYSDRVEALYTAAYDKARRRDTGVPPALVDIRREQSPAQVVTTMRVKKKSFGFWKSFVRIYVRMMPQHTDSPVPGELKPYQLVKTILGWKRGGHHWTVLAEREPLDEYDALPAEWVLLLIFLQPADPNVRLGYKGRAEHPSHSVPLRHQGCQTGASSILGACWWSVSNNVLCMMITGVATLSPLTSAPRTALDPAVPAGIVVRALVALSTPDPAVPVAWLMSVSAPPDSQVKLHIVSHAGLLASTNASGSQLLCLRVFLPVKHRPKSAMAGVRVGEASHPGPNHPKRARSEGPPPEVRDGDVTPLPVRRRRQGKQQVPSQELVAEDAWIAEFDEPESPAAPGSGDDGTSAVPSSLAATSSQDVPMGAGRPSMKVSAHRLTGTQALVGATYLGDKKVWRWQVRSHPPFAGTERQHPADSLEAFIRSHSAKFDAASLELLHVEG